MSTVGEVKTPVTHKVAAKEVNKVETPHKEGAFTKSARSLKSDVFSLLAMNASLSMYPLAGKFFGLPISIMKGVEGFVELSEGMLRQDKHEVIDGAFNMFIGGAIAATSVFPFFYLPYSYSYAGVGTSLILAKLLYDNPKELFLEEPKNLLCNTGYAIGLGAKGLGRSIWNGMKKPFAGAS